MSHLCRTFAPWCLVALVFAPGVTAAAEKAGGPYQATGFKVCEVDTHSAIVWTRLTRNAERMGKDRPMPEVLYINPKTGKPEKGAGRRNRTPVVRYPKGSSIDTIEGACPGAPGEVRVRYRARGAKEWSATDWRRVDPKRDFTAQFHLGKLEPATRYEVQVEARADAKAPPGETLTGGFRTAPPADRPARVMFTVSTGQAYPDQDVPTGGYKIYPSMQKLDPDFFVHTGDIVYYDRLAKNIALARWHWQRTYSLPTNEAFHRHVASYFIKDDHDTWSDDSWPTKKSKFMGDFTFKQGQAVFREQVGMGEKTYRTIRWGKDLQVWLVEGRDFRSPNPMPDGPAKTIWGAEQKAWFKRTVKASDATFRVLISPTPLVGPDRASKNDNHSNKGFTHEGDELRAFIASQKNMVVVCGDRHWQYHSIHPKTGVREYSCGPASDKHAGGWKQSDYRKDYHRFLKVKGGFLSVTADREGGKPTLTFRFHDVNGKVRYTDKLTAK
jgi:alkaline phosphatase D